MRPDQTKYLCCPKCRLDLKYTKLEEQGQKYICLACASGDHTYPVIKEIPRFVGAQNYAASFGFQWNVFSRVQLDSYNGSGFSEQRFQDITGWGKRDLEGKLVLDAGCGAGRFAEVVAGKYGADLIAF